METQVTGRESWVEVDTTQGIEFIRVADTSLFVRDSETQVQPLTDTERDAYAKQIQAFCTGIVQSWKTIRGYGVRQSAPGYLDCTDWTVYDTLDEANEAANEDSDEDEDEDGDEGSDNA
ncbi:MAG: hypothetical protein WAN50_00175 [Minisyncoccia bacterium]